MRTSRFSFALFVWMGLSSTIQSVAQTLTIENHMPIVTDSLWVYELPYVAVTDTGYNCVWDFSSLSVDSAESIEVDYFAPSMTDTSFFGCHREHSNYYYHQRKDTLWLTGYETSRTYMRYSNSVPLLRFPFSYGDSLCGPITGKGQYCHMTSLAIDGRASSIADGRGCLILPEDTFYNVLQVHTRIQYRETKRMQNFVHEERYAWYSPYCRYPLLESVYVQTIQKNDTVSFAFMYYYPQEHENEPRPKEEQQDSLVVAMDSLVTNISYLPNPVYNDVQIKYSLSRPAQVYISMHYNGGVTTYQTPVRREDEGEHLIYVNMSGMPIGSYAVYIHADDTVVSGNIIKL